MTPVATSAASVTREPARRVVDAGVRAVRVALVLADVGDPARGEVAAEDQVGQRERRVVGRGAGRRGAGHPHGRLHRAGPVEQQRRAGRRHGQRRARRRPRPWRSSRSAPARPRRAPRPGRGRRRARARCPPARPARACTLRSASACTAWTASRRRQLAAVRVVAVHPAQQRLARDDAGLAAVDRQLLDEPVALALDLAVGVGRAGQHLADQVEQPARGRGRARSRRPPAGRCRCWPTASRRAPAGRPRAAARCAGRCRAAGCRRAAGPWRRGRARRRRTAPAGAPRRAGTPGPADGEHAQAVRQRALGDGRQLGRAGGAEARGRGGQRCVVTRGSRAGSRGRRGRRRGWRRPPARPRR